VGTRTSTGTSTPPTESVEHEIGATVETIGQIEPRHEQPEMPASLHVGPRVVRNDVEPHVGLLAFGPRLQALRPRARSARREVHVVDAVRIERRARLDRRITTTEADVGIVETVPEHARMHRQRLVRSTGAKVTTIGVKRTRLAAHKLVGPTDARPRHGGAQRAATPMRADVVEQIQLSALQQPLAADLPRRQRPGQNQRLDPAAVHAEPLGRPLHAHDPSHASNIAALLHLTKGSTGPSGV
jgi:hypothetical protein